VRVRELALGRGVGAKLWNAALMLANDLDEHPDWCRGKRVLELGAGVGLCGLLAAKLGAAEVCMTDFEDPLLEALERSARDAEEEDRDEAEGGGGERSPGVKPFAISRGVARVARCDWREEAAAESGWADRSASAASATDRSASAASKNSKTPSLLPDETFDFVFGSDLLYEPYHAETLPAVIARRMARNPPGRCRVVGAVRDRAMLDAFATRCERRGLRVAETSLRGNRADEWYEGGFVALEMTHAS
jgi:predicted nicotinamide N-methyase